MEQFREGISMITISADK